MRPGEAGAAFAWTLASEGASKLAVLGTMLIAARALAPRDFGLYVGLAAVALLAATLWDAGISTVLTREHAAGRLPAQEAARQSVVLRGRTIALWALPFAGGIAVLARGGDVGFEETAWAAALSVTAASSLVPLSLLRGALRFGAAGLAAASGRWLTAGLTVLTLTPVLSGDVTTLLAVLAAGEAVTVAVAVLALLRSRPAAAPAAPVVRLRLRDGLPFTLNGLLAVAYNRLDVVVLGALAGQEQLGVYAPASRFQDAAYVLPVSLGSVVLPFASRMERGVAERADAQRAIRMLIGVGLLIAFAAALTTTVFADTIVRTAIGEQYASSATAMRIMIWFLPIACIGSPVLMTLAATGHAGDTTKVFATAFAAAMILHLGLDWRFGATGGAIATLGRDIAVLVTIALVGHKTGLLALPVRAARRSSRLAAAAEVLR